MMIGPRNSPMRGPRAILDRPISSAQQAPVAAQSYRDSREGSQTHDPSASDGRRRRTGRQPRPGELDELGNDEAQLLFTLRCSHGCKVTDWRSRDQASTWTGSAKPRPAFKLLQWTT